MTLNREDRKTMLRAMVDFHLDADRHFLFMRRLAPDVPVQARDLYLYPMAYGNLRVSLSPEGDVEFITSNYCFHDHERAWDAALHWDGHGDPVGWIRHISTGRRQEFDAAGELVREWVQP